MRELDYRDDEQSTERIFHIEAPVGFYKSQSYQVESPERNF